MSKRKINDNEIRNKTKLEKITGIVEAIIFKCHNYALKVKRKWYQLDYLYLLASFFFSQIR